MRLALFGIVGAGVVAIGGGSGYVGGGNRDFTVDVGRPLPEVYQTFSGIKTFGSGLRNEGFDVPEIVVSRPSDHELVFTAPSANPGQISHIAFTFEPGANSAMTKVTAAIEVPPVHAYIDGEHKMLSEDKVETLFKQAIGDMAKQMNQGNSITVPSHKFNLLLDSVAIASHPDLYNKMKARIEHLQAAEKRINAQLRKEHEEKRASWKRDIGRARAAEGEPIY